MCDFHSICVNREGRIAHEPRNSHSAAVAAAGWPENTDRVTHFVECEWDGRGTYALERVVSLRNGLTINDLTNRQVAAIGRHYRALARVMSGDISPILPGGILHGPEYWDVYLEAAESDSVSPADRDRIWKELMTVTAGFNGIARAGYRGTATAGYKGTAEAGSCGTATAGDEGAARAGDFGAARAGERGAARAGDFGAARAGERGTATAGYKGTATVGDYGTATAGDEGTARAEYRGTATAGNGGTATAGYRGTATAGERGTATAGDEGAARAGAWGTATAGDDGTARAGDDGTARAGYFGTARAGYIGRVQAGLCGILILQYYNAEKNLPELRTAAVDGEQILPDTLYKLDLRGNFVLDQP